MAQYLGEKLGVATMVQLERLEVVETGRRRRWSDDEKLLIVTENLHLNRHPKPQLALLLKDCLLSRGSKKAPK